MLQVAVHEELVAVFLSRNVCGTLDCLQVGSSTNPCEHNLVCNSENKNSPPTCISGEPVDERVKVDARVSFIGRGEHFVGWGGR